MLKDPLREQLYELNSSFSTTAKGRGSLEGHEHTADRAVRAFDDRHHGRYLHDAVCHAVRPVCRTGLDWLYFDMMTLIALFLGVFGGVFNTYSSLYKAKDNDLMLSRCRSRRGTSSSSAYGRLPHGTYVQRRRHAARRHSYISSSRSLPSKALSAHCC